VPSKVKLKILKLPIITCSACQSNLRPHPAFLALCRKVIREDGVDVFVELDVGSDYNNNEEEIRSVLYNVVKEGAIASYITSVQGFQFRQLGKGKTSISCEVTDSLCF